MGPARARSAPAFLAAADVLAVLRDGRGSPATHAATAVHEAASYLDDGALLLERIDRVQRCFLAAGAVRGTARDGHAE